MRHLLLTSLILLSCSRIDSGGADGIDLAPYKAERDRICAEFDAETVERCDRSTFHLLMAAMCPGMDLPTQYEVPSGKWNRDTSPCYPEHSRSETSRDAYLSLLLTQNKAAITRAVSFADESGDTGAPAGGVGNIRDLLPLMRKTAGLSLTAPGEADGLAEDISEAVKKALTGHRGHLIAGYLWARARVNGGLTLAGSKILSELHESTPDSPYLSCLYHRFSRLDDSQSGTIALLKKIDRRENAYGWGSSPGSAHYALTLGCLEGR